MDIISGQKLASPPRVPPFCDCEFPQNNEIGALKYNIHETVKCRCGENVGSRLEWSWENNSADLAIHGQEVTFHPVFSQGTCMVRGNKRLMPKMIHYWEVRILTALSGTDVMIGIGTDKVNLLTHRYRFTSALGLTTQSWGYSYHGRIQHDNELKRYGKRFSQGCIIGVYLDLLNGKLEYFANRRPMGVAFTNIPVGNKVKLYPMVCSTAAKSSLRLINSVSCDDSLQFQCMRVISKRPRLLNEVKKMPGMRPMLENYWFLISKEQYEYSNDNQKKNLDLEDEVVLTLKPKKLKIDDLDVILENDVEYNDLYSDAHNIAHKTDDDSDDDETSPFIYYTSFCEH